MVQSPTKKRRVQYEMYTINAPKRTQYVIDAHMGQLFYFKTAVAYLYSAFAFISGEVLKQ